MMLVMIGQMWGAEIAERGLRKLRLEIPQQSQQLQQFSSSATSAYQEPLSLDDAVLQSAQLPPSASMKVPLERSLDMVRDECKDTPLCELGCRAIDSCTSFGDERNRPSSMPRKFLVAWSAGYKNMRKAQP